MKAGRELDERVAVEVMGWHKDQRPDHYHWLNEEGGETGYDWLDKPIRPFDPSTNIAVAWEVLEKLREPLFRIKIEIAADQWDMPYVTCDLFGVYSRQGQHGFARADTAPPAICLAGLQAVGSKI